MIEVTFELLQWFINELETQKVFELFRCKFNYVSIYVLFVGKIVSPKLRLCRFLTNTMSGYLGEFISWRDATTNL